MLVLLSVNIINAQDTIRRDEDIKDTLRHVQLEQAIIQSVRAERVLPVTETSLDRKTIRQNYIGQEMPVLLVKTPSVSWYSDGGNSNGYSYMRLRGIDQTRINFTLNGVPLNEPEDQGAYFSNYPDFLNSVNSIQVQRGVGISTNGVASFAGSVNIESPFLNDSAYTGLSMDYGSYNTYRVSPEFNTGILKNNWSFYGRFSSLGSDGFREHSGTKGQSFFFSGGYIGRKGILKFTSFIGSSKSQMAYLAVADTSLKKNYRQNDLSKNEKDEFQQSVSMLQYIVPLGRHSVLNASVYYTYLTGGYSILFAPDLYKFSVKSDFTGAILNYGFHKKSLNLNLGLHAYDYVRYHYASIEPNEDISLYRNAGRKREISSFLKVSYDFQKLTLFADIQYRSAKFVYKADKKTPVDLAPVSWQFINPKVGVSYLLNKKHVLYVSAGYSSREPTRNDMFSGYDNIDSLNVSEVGSLDRVKPESVIDLELGAKLDFEKMKLNVNLYDMQFKNEIAAIGQLSYIGLPLRKNVESSYRRGAELYVILAPLRGLVFTTYGCFSNNRIRRYTTDYDSVTYENVKPLLTPEIIIGQEAGYSYKWFRVGLDGRYLSQSFLSNSNGNNIVPASFIFNGSVGFYFLKRQSINFMINNILGTEYYTSGYVQGTQSYYFAMSTRSYTVSLKLLF